MIPCLSPQLHIVHYDSDSYHSLSEAAARPQGLAVLGVLLEVSGPPPRSPSTPCIPQSYSTGVCCWSPSQGKSTTTLPLYSLHGLMPNSPPFLSFQVGETENPAYEHILSHLHKIRYKGEPKKSVLGQSEIGLQGNFPRPHPKRPQRPGMRKSGIREFHSWRRVPVSEGAVR